LAQFDFEFGPKTIEANFGCLLAFPIVFNVIQMFFCELAAAVAI